MLCASCPCAGCVRSESAGARLEGQCGAVRENLTKLVLAEEASQAQPGTARGPSPPPGVCMY